MTFHFEQGVKVILLQGTVLVKFTFYTPSLLAIDEY